MNSIFDAATLQSILWRIEKLGAKAEPQWGKMNVSQMMAHCSEVLEMSLGIKKYKRDFKGLIFGRFAKTLFTNEKPLKQNLPAMKGFKIVEEREFAKEKERLVSLINQFAIAGPQAVQNKIHPFFGKMTPDEWGFSTVKHLDHHLRQFGA